VIRQVIRDIVALIRLFLSLAIAFSSLAGYVIFQGGSSRLYLPLFSGVFLLAAGSSVLNQVMERKRDRLMDRTRNRPVASERISPFAATTLGVVISFIGFVVLFRTYGWLPSLLGLGNLLWYIFLYTPLKTRSYFAVLAGAVNGAVPPLIGWTAAGGSLSDPVIIGIGFFLFTWQIPHFWLLLMIHGEEYRAAGYFDITSRFSDRGLKTLLMIWVTATGISSVELLFFGIITSPSLICILLTANVILLILFGIALFTTTRILRLKALFVFFNSFMVLVFSLILLQGVLE